METTAMSWFSERVKCGACVLFVAVPLLAVARPAAAADLNVALPVVTAAPGAVVQIPIEVDRSLVPFGVEAIQYTLPINPTLVSVVTPLAEGLMWNWGPPVQNVTSTFVAVVTAGTTPITSSVTRLHTLQLTVSPTAPVPSDMPLSLSLIRFNEGVPTAQTVAGVLHVRTGAAVGDGPGAGGFALRPATPNPVRGATRLAFELPAGAAGERLSLVVYGLDGRRVRTLRGGFAVPGAQEAAWDARDDAGRRVPAGIYFVRLECGARRVARRLAVID
jgi:hypothetical protein